MVQCTPTKKARIVQMRASGQKFPDIANILGLHPSTVRRNWAKVHQTKDFYAKPTRTGRPRLLSPRSLRRAEREITSGRVRDGSDVKRQLFPTVGASTIRRNLCEIGLNGRVRRPKPLLSKIHIQKRRAWANNHADWTEEDWQKTVVSDESKFNLVGSDGRSYCRRRSGEEFLERNVKKTVKHRGGSLMVWGCLTWNGTGRLHRVEGHMNAIQYCSILTESLLGTLSDYSLDPSDVIFVQDNDPKHTSKLATKWFKDSNITVLPWAPSSPDMNIIEHGWEALDRQLRTRDPLPQNLDELWEALQEEWAKLDLEVVRNLYLSMPRRVAALLEAKGKYTKY